MADRKICSVPGCDKLTEIGRNDEMCSAHRWRRQRHGDPLGGSRFRNVRWKWLEEHRDYNGPGCLIWPYARLKTNGYGVIHKPGSKTTTSVARVMCELAHGSPPADWYEAAHSCGRGRDGCVNPQHIRWATPVENRADKRLHGTHLEGAKHYKAKLSDEQVAYIRRVAGTHSQAFLARELGVSRSIISRVILGQTYV